MAAEGEGSKAPDIGAVAQPSGVRRSVNGLEALDAPPAVPTRTLRAGDTLLDGRYRIVRWLGEGGMGVVYEASDAVLRIPVALKTLSRLDAAGIYRLKNEFRSVASLVHENLIRLYELHADDERWFFTMSLVDGVPFTDHVREDADLGFQGTIDARSARQPALDETVRGAVLATGRRTGAVRERTLRDALCQLASGVDAIHRAGKLHRDLKPSNVLVTRSGRVLILDFGLVSEHGADAIGQTLLDEGISGTPAYMAPEQAQGERATTASDWYAVGVMLFQALTGELPFDGSVYQVMHQKLTADAPQPSSCVPNIPADLDRLCVELLRRRAEERPSGDELMARFGVTRGAAALTSSGSLPAPRSASVFVGREAELCELRDCLHRTDGGVPVVALVAGPSGIGKTALIERFLEQTRSTEEVIVLAGRCYEREAMPYKAFDGVIDALSRHLRRLDRAGAAQLMPRNVQALVRLFPVLERVDVIAAARQRVPLPVDPQELRRRGVGALKEILSRMADAGRVILAIDDLQWGDLDSVKLLRELCAPPDPPAVVVLGTYRNDQPSAFLEELFNEERGLRDVDVRTLTLGSLSEAEVRELVHATAGDGLDVVAIEREARGSPYFVTELVRHAAAARGERAEMKLEAALRARFAALPDAAQRLLVTIAVAGRPLERALAAHAASLDTAAAVDAFETLRSSALIRSVTHHAAAPTFTTYHDRVREALVATVPDAERRACHRALADALQGSGGGDPEALSQHCLEAGDLALAGRFALEAARRASDILAFERAAMLYRIALDHGVEPNERLGLLVELAEALVNAGRNADAARAFVAAAKLADEASARRLTSRAGEHLLLAGHIDEGRAILDEVLRGYEIVLPGDPMQALQQAWMLDQEFRSRGLAFREQSHDDLPPAALERIDTLRSAMLGISTVIVGPEASVLTSRLALDALELGEPARVVRALGMHCILAASPEQWQPAEACVELMAALGSKLSQTDVEAWVELARGALPFWQGRLREALPNLLRADELWSERCVGVAREQATTRLYLGIALFDTGRVGEACERMHRWAKEADDRNDLFLAARCGTQPQIRWLPLDDPERARLDLGAALARWARPEFDHVTWVGRIGEAVIELYDANGERAWDLTLGYFDQFIQGPLSFPPMLRYWSFWARGSCALGAAAQSREPQPLLEAAASCASEIERLGLPASQAAGHLLRGGIAEIHGDAAQAIDHYARAIALGEHLNAVSAAAASARRGRLLGGDEGRELVTRGHAVLSAEGIKNPARWLRLVTPASLRD